MIHKLQHYLKEHGIDAYIIPTGDPHDTEYVCEHFAFRKAVSGFTGSAGTLVVLQDQAYLWTDGRYYIQAAQQLEGSGIQLMKAGLSNTPTIAQLLVQTLKPGSLVAYDGKLISMRQTCEYKKTLEPHDIQIRTDLDLAQSLWEERPSLPCTKTFTLEKQYSGKTITDKCTQVREKIEEKGCKEMIITKIDEVAWLFNLRADDIPSFPVALAYAYLSLDHATLYINRQRLDDISLRHLQSAGVDIRDYEDIYEDVKQLEGPVLIDEETINTTLCMSLNCQSVHAISPVLLLKAVKNETEIACTRQAHIRDGVAVTKFMYWLYREIGHASISECSAQKQLQSFRKEQDLYIEDSFTTISAYKEHAAMMHYSADASSDIPLEKEGFYLVDSGGHYYDGTTDITRTFVLGPLTKEQKKWYTLALMGHIDLARCRWLYGAKGSQLDILARNPLWQHAMDYQCGTGHGVGHVLSVHEDPNAIRSKGTPREAVLEAGMITSDEPGVYLEGQYGIRHENELLAVNDKENEYGQFMHFEVLTMVPFCTEGLDLSLMNADQLDWLNQYHQTVYDTIHPYLSEEEKDWLYTITRPLPL